MTALISTPAFWPVSDVCVKRSEHWYESRDADPIALALYLRHYSSKKNRSRRDGRNDSNCFVGPGEKMVLLTAAADALFVWKWERHRKDGQEGINCQVFRNESSVLSSVLIREAMYLAWEEWPDARLFTFVDAEQVRRKRDPGRCFRRAGWNDCGFSKDGKLIMEVFDR